MSVEQAIKVLTDAGAVFALPRQRHLSLQEAAGELSVCRQFIRDHMDEFPNRFRLPGGGDWRIPSRDVDALAVRLRAVKK